MLLIQSSETDNTTSYVIQWLMYYGVKFQRVNGEMSIFSCDFRLESGKDIEITLSNTKGESIELSQVSTFWYRRGDWHIGRPKLDNFAGQTFGVLNQEWRILRETIEYYLESRPHLGSIKSEKYHNKIKSLTIANSIGILIPETIITGNKESMINRIRETSYITKAIWNMFNIEDKGRHRTVGTNRVREENIECLQPKFYPTLIQKEIFKAFELRIFFLGQQFYSMAIFSQSDQQTELDFRNYNKEKPNRNVPFNLPLEIRLKLLKFIKKMNLDTGSIDMVVTQKGEFVFLEVNPLGQFGWVSDNCNYYLEEKIALYFKSIVS